jgi:VanZ family protein
MVTGAPRDLEHIAAFALVGLLLSLAYPDKRLKLVTCGIAAIAAVELMQVIVPGRHAYVSDFLLNTFGACIGLTATRVFVRTSIRDGSAPG